MDGFLKAKLKPFREALESRNLEHQSVSLEEAMCLAIDEALKFEGSTAPNPPVGAVVLDSNNRVLGIFAHQKAGQPHAEALALSAHLPQAHTLVVTLEPCSTVGKTPACTDAILKSQIKNVVYGCPDPNPNHQNRAISILSRNGIEIFCGVLQKQCEALIQGFKQRIETHIPKVIVKVALNENGSMVPDQGQKTFTRDSSLILAHELRKSSDAILTGSETILRDLPLFTVRNVPDFEDKKRLLLIGDRRKRISKDTFKKYENLGFVVKRFGSIQEAFEIASEFGINQILVEAGPTLSEIFIKNNLWNEKIIIRREKDEDTLDWSHHSSPLWNDPQWKTNLKKKGRLD